jgi:hypothetical protein
MLLLRLSGVLLLRLAGRQFLVPPPAGLFQLPPRFTRFEPDTAVGRSPHAQENSRFFFGAFGPPASKGIEEREFMRI